MPSPTPPWFPPLPRQIYAFSDHIQAFRDIGCEVVGISVDSVHSHLAWANTPRNKGGLGGCTFPLVSDLTKSISKDYEVLIEDGEDAGVAFRGLFIIDKDGKLRQKTINDLPVGRNVEEALRLVKAFQFSDVHGEVCPANWTEGKKTMKADPVGSKEYFSALCEQSGRSFGPHAPGPSP